MTVAPCALEVPVPYLDELPTRPFRAVIDQSVIDTVPVERVRTRVRLHPAPAPLPRVSPEWRALLAAPWPVEPPPRPSWLDRLAAALPVVAFGAVATVVVLLVVSAVAS